MGRRRAGSISSQQAWQPESPEWDVDDPRRGSKEHAHTRRVVQSGENVFERLSQSHTQASQAKTLKVDDPRVLRRDSMRSQGSSVHAALAALEGRREELVESPTLGIY